MKRQLKIVFSILLSVSMILHADTVSTSGLRSWEISANNLSQSDEILSKVCLLEDLIDNTFVGTFTVLDQLLDKVCTVDSKVDVIDDELGTVHSTLITIESKIEIVDQNIDVIVNTINQIHVDDFGGTWTALEELQSTLCDKFDMAFSDIDEIESKLDLIAGRQQSHFADTFTALQVVSENVLEILVELESLSDQLSTDLSQVDMCIVSAIDIMCTVDSKVDTLLEVEIPTNFAGTFTAIDELLEKACTVESKLDDLELTIENNQVATFTALAAVEEKLCTVASKVDVVEIEVSVIDSFVDQILIDMNAGYSKACTIDSKLDLIDDKMVTIDSKVDVIADKTTTIESAIDVIDTDATSMLAKSCTTLSRVDVIDTIAVTLESKVDIFNLDLITIESKVDALTLNTLFSKICTLDSRVDVIDLQTITIASKVDELDLSRITLESKIDTITPEVTTILSKLCTIDSKVDVIDDEIVITTNRLTTIESKVDIISSEVSVVDVQAITLNATMVTIESKVDVIDGLVDTVLSKVCTIDSHIDVIDSKIDILGGTIGGTEDKAIDLNEDMVSTWTALQALEDKVCTIEDQAFTISSKLDEINPVVDFSAVFTVIDALTEKACTILDGVVTLESKIDVQNSNCITDLGPTFTALATTIDTVCTLESKVDVLVTDIQNIVATQGIAIGTPVTQADFSDTFSITEPGRYFLTEDIDFNPGGNSAIYVDANDVHIDLCNRTIRQTNSNEDTSGIIIASGRSNISIANGTVRDFDLRGIIVECECSFIRFENLAVLTTGIDPAVGDGFNIDQNTQNIMFRRVTVVDVGDDAIDINSCSGIMMFSVGVFGSGSHAFRLNGSDYIVIKDGIAMGNASGYVFTPVVGVQATVFGATNFVVESSKAVGSSEDGILINHFSKNGVIINCVVESSGDNGIAFDEVATSGPLPSQKICVVHNVFSNNTNDGIRININAENNYFAFNQIWENGSNSIQEDASEGPNTYLGNIGYKSSGTNFNMLGNSVLNSAAIQEDASFPTPEPTYWINVNMTPT